MLASSIFVLCFCLPSAHIVTSAAASNPHVLSNSSLELNVGLNLSISASFLANGSAISEDLMFARAIQIGNVDGGLGDLFLPILSSPGFKSTNSSESLGFSFGFYFSLLDSYIYLAVCAGLSGNYSSSNSSNTATLSGKDDFDLGYLLFPETVLDGYAVPVWIANLDSPLTSVNSSLVVVSDVLGGATSSNELQLRNQNGTVVWKVSNVGMMEMQDAGNLVIYDPVSRTNAVWQSSTDTLLHGQMMTVGKELISNDSSYFVRMEKGGLVFYLNNTEFIEKPPPYRVIPILAGSVTNWLDLNTLVSSSPCPNDTAYSMLGKISLDFYLEPGPCSDLGSQIFSDSIVDYANIISWSFIKLESDGSLYIYAVNSGTSRPTTERYEAHAIGTNLSRGGEIYFDPYTSGECDNPMACGPFGVCSPGTISLCSCPYPSTGGINFFDATDYNDIKKGCRRVTSLPNCSIGNEHINTTDFLQMNQTASIFLFGGWAFNSTFALVADVCKKSCSSNCFCNGFFYQANSSACFFITDEISLLNITDGEFLLKSTDYGEQVPFNSTFFTTYVKVASAANNSIGSSSGPANSVAPAGNKIAIAVVSSCVACLVFGLAVYLVRARKSRMNKQASQAKEEEELRDILPLLPSRFSYQDLHEATEAFSKLLGAGGCGSVYAGVLPDGRKIAVKILESLLKGQSKQFLAEVATIGRTSHHNIVRLVGFCWEVSQRMLVYEHVENGSLDHWLFVKGEAESAADGFPAPLLSWQTRYDVVLGIARGLSYLHEECPQPILHFDIKPQNILLDGAFVAKLADFGMSRLMQREVSEVVTGVRGTPGYIAPEWLSHGAVSKKSDVYSMGMVLLEIVGGRRNVDLALDPAQHEEWYFPSWAAKKCEQGLMMEVVDKRLKIFDEEQVERVIHVAFWCIHENPGMRPYAPTVVHWLEGSSPLKEPPFYPAVRPRYRVDECLDCFGASIPAVGRAEGSRTNI